MALPLIPILVVAAVGSFGAFVGSQVDDAIDNQTRPQEPNDYTPSPFTIAYYAALAMGLYFIADRTGSLKALGLK